MRARAAAIEPLRRGRLRGPRQAQAATRHPRPVRHGHIARHRGHREEPRARSSGEFVGVREPRVEGEGDSGPVLWRFLTFVIHFYAQSSV